MSALRQVLVIGDDEAVCDAFVEALEETPYHVETASSGDEGAQKARTQPFGLIFLELALSLEDGVETLRALRVTNADVPIYIATAFHGEFLGRLEIAQSEGLSFQLVHKPVGQDAIREVVRAVFEGPAIVAGGLR